MTARGGLFITFEGGEGVGKTTQLRLLTERLQQSGRTFVKTREPGGTPEAERIRNLLVQREGGDWVPMAEILLFFAARVQHAETLIRPALARGEVVVSDRFTDSTRVYQAYGRGVDRKVIEDVNTLTLGDFKPDLTIILDIDPQVGLARSLRATSAAATSAAQTEDRFEQLGISFHARIREGFLTIAAEDPDRCVVVDAAQDVDKVAETVWAIVEQRLAAHG